MENKIRVLIAEDHATVRGAVRMLLEREPDIEVVGEAQDGGEAVKFAKKLNPDVILMDIGMPDVDGAQATRRIKSTLPDTKVLVLTRHDEDGYLKKLIAEGADGYVLKLSAPSILVAAVRQVSLGNGFLDPSVTASMVWDMAERHRPPEHSSSNELSDRETSVLRLTALGYSIKEIAVHLDLSSNIVESCKKSASKKLGLSSRVAIIRYAITQGWMHDN